MKRLLISLLTTVVLAIATIAIIAYGRGFRFNPRDGEVAATGLLNATSDPDGAQVYIDGVLKTATDSTVSLLPGTYQVRIVKEGYLPWEKQMPIYKEVVSQTEAFLFPANPGLSPLTTSGVKNPTVSPDGASVAYVRKPSSANLDESTPAATSASDLRLFNSDFGIFVLDLEDRPLSFSRKPRRIVSFSDLDPEASNLEPRLLWSPDAKTILAAFSANNETTEIKFAYLLDVGRSNPQPRLVASPAEILQLWDERRKIEFLSKLESLPDKLLPIASASAELLSFSPDESKILYRATKKATIPPIIKPPLIGTNPTPDVRAIEPGNLYVYDAKEDRNYLIPPTVGNRRPTAGQDANSKSLNLKWFPTSRHFYFVDQGKIKVMEYDGANQLTVYAGPFEPDFVVPWPNGSKFVILTTLNPDASETLNLYAVKLR